MPTRLLTLTTAFSFQIRTPYTRCIRSVILHRTLDSGVHNTRRRRGVLSAPIVEAAETRPANPRANLTLVRPNSDWKFERDR